MKRLGDYADGAWWMVTHPVILARFVRYVIRTSWTLWQIERLYRAHERRHERNR